MPPFVSTECPYCKHRNRFDLAELNYTDVVAFRRIDLRSLIGDEEEFSVTCSNCGRKFKLTVKRGKDGPEK